MSTTSARHSSSRFITPSVNNIVAISRSSDALLDQVPIKNSLLTVRIAQSQQQTSDKQSAGVKSVEMERLSTAPATNTSSLALPGMTLLVGGWPVRLELCWQARWRL